MICVYDGSFEGLLSVAAEARRTGAVPSEVVRTDAWQPSLLDDARTITTDSTAARELMQALRDAGSNRVARNVIYCYLSEQPGFEAPVVAYVMRMLRDGAGADRHHADPTVRAVHTLAQKVGREVHRLTGLVRFRELQDGTFWAPIEPDYNVAYSVAVHFARRLPNQDWVIYDMGRDYGVAWRAKEFELVNMDPQVRDAAARIAEAPDDVITEREAHYQDLWRLYFRTIAIGTRVNPRLQRSLMPQRYWAYLVEKPQKTEFRSQETGVRRGV
jgi:probable DNA metabolism protein